MTFDQALRALKAGCNVGRRSWLEKGACLAIIDGCQSKLIVYRHVWFDTTGVHGWPSKPCPQFSQRKWFASDDDLLAEDWMIVDVKWHMEHPHG